MLQTVEGIIDVDGQIRWLEPLRVSQPSRVIVTLLQDHNNVSPAKGSAENALQSLRKNRLPDAARPTVVEIEAQITEARESWD
jgi:hypothetical protein